MPHRAVQITAWLRLPMIVLAALILAGTSVASAANRQDPAELYVVTGRGAPIDISRSAAADVSPSISPRSDRIAFWSDRRRGHEDLYLVSPDGSNLVRVAGIDPRSSDVEFVGPIVFVDGGATLYTSYSDQTKPLHPTTAAFRVDVRDASAIRLPWCHGTPEPAPTRGLVACPISGHDPHFMPTTNTAVWRSRSTGTATRVATIIGSPIAWTPNARDLLVRRDLDLSVVTPGTKRSGRTIYHGDVATVSFPHGSTTAIVDDPWTHRFEVSIAGGPVTQLASVTYPTPVISASGRQAFFRHLGDSVALVVTNPKGRAPRVVARYGKTTYETPTWFPDGNRLLISVVVDGPHRG